MHVVEGGYRGHQRVKDGREILNATFVYLCALTSTYNIIIYQVFAEKDKYGRHVKGSDKQVKEVVDYVVFERHLSNKYGKWRVCGKLFPKPPQQKKQITELQLAGKNVPSV